MIKITVTAIIAISALAGLYISRAEAQTAAAQRTATAVFEVG